MTTVRKYLRFYWMYFTQFWKSRLVYKADFLLGFVGQLVSIAVSLSFITLLYTQTRAIAGWSYHEVLFLTGLGGFIMNLHHIFFFGIYRLGDEFIVSGKMDRVLLRPLNPLFQVYADHIADDDVSKLIVNAALLVWVVPKVGVELTPLNALYFLASVVSGVMIFAAIYLAFATTAFWSGRSRAAIRIIFRLSDFRKYPYTIYGTAVQVVLVTLVPIAFASFFPASYLLRKPGFPILKLVTVVAGPVAFLLAYRFWTYGLTKYNSTGS
jgi:ABC-2 type transport system permease protein